MRTLETPLFSTIWAGIWYSGVLEGADHKYDIIFTKFQDGGTLMRMRTMGTPSTSTIGAGIWYPGILAGAGHKYEIKFTTFQKGGH